MRITVAVLIRPEAESPQGELSLNNARRLDASPQHILLIRDVRRLGDAVQRVEVASNRTFTQN